MENEDAFNYKIRLPLNIDNLINKDYYFDTESQTYIIKNFENDYIHELNLICDNISKQYKVELIDFVKLSLPILKSDINFLKIQYKKDEHPHTSVALEFTKTKYKDLKKWIKERLKEPFNDNQEIESFNEDKKFPKYCEIGSLIAQGFISWDKGNFYYKEKTFESTSKIAKYLVENILKKKASIRQYIGGTLKQGKSKDFYRSKKMMSNIIDYCNHKNLKITDDFQSKYNDLINLH